MAIKWTPEKKVEASEQILRRICEGESVRSILDCANRDLLPDYSTFLAWVEADKSLAKHYARAMEVRADKIFEEIIEIADESNADLSVSEKGTLVIDGEAVARSRLRVDARKWALSKMMPKKYGDKLEHDHRSSDGSMSPAPTSIVFTKPDAENQ